MNAVRILPRRYLIHPTLQPIQPVMKSKQQIVNVRIPSTARACGEYRECAALLRTLGQDMAAGLLEATADALYPRPVDPIAVPTVVPPALEDYDSYDDETVVRDIDSLLGEDTLSGAEIPE